MEDCTPGLGVQNYQRREDDWVMGRRGFQEILEEAHQ